MDSSIEEHAQLLSLSPPPSSTTPIYGYEEFGELSLFPEMPLLQASLPTSAPEQKVNINSPNPLDAATSNQIANVNGCTPGSQGKSLSLDDEYLQAIEDFDWHGTGGFREEGFASQTEDKAGLEDTEVDAQPGASPEPMEASQTLPTQLERLAPSQNADASMRTAQTNVNASSPPWIPDPPFTPVGTVLTASPPAGIICDDSETESLDLIDRDAVNEHGQRMQAPGQGQDELDITCHLTNMSMDDGRAMTPTDLPPLSFEFSSPATVPRCATPLPHFDQDPMIEASPHASLNVGQAPIDNIDVPIENAQRNINGRTSTRHRITTPTPEQHDATMQGGGDLTLEEQLKEAAASDLRHELLHAASDDPVTDGVQDEDEVMQGVDRHATTGEVMLTGAIDAREELLALNDEAWSLFYQLVYPHAQQVFATMGEGEDLIAFMQRQNWDEFLGDSVPDAVDRIREGTVSDEDAVQYVQSADAPEAPAMDGVHVRLTRTAAEHVDEQDAGVKSEGDGFVASLPADVPQTASVDVVMVPATPLRAEQVNEKDTLQPEEPTESTGDDKTQGEIKANDSPKATPATAAPAATTRTSHDEAMEILTGNVKGKDRPQSSPDRISETSFTPGKYDNETSSPVGRKEAAAPSSPSGVATAGHLSDKSISPLSLSAQSQRTSQGERSAQRTDPSHDLAAVGTWVDKDMPIALPRTIVEPHEHKHPIPSLQPPTHLPSADSHSSSALSEHSDHEFAASPTLTRKKRLAPTSTASSHPPAKKAKTSKAAAASSKISSPVTVYKTNIPAAATPESTQPEPAPAPKSVLKYKPRPKPKPTCAQSTPPASTVSTRASAKKAQNTPAATRARRTRASSAKKNDAADDDDDAEEDAGEAGDAEQEEEKKVVQEKAKPARNKYGFTNRRGTRRKSAVQGERKRREG